MPVSSLGADAAQVPATLHSRISAWLREQIASGAWPAHYRLKPEPELAVELMLPAPAFEAFCANNKVQRLDT